MFIRLIFNRERFEKYFSEMMMDLASLELIETRFSERIIFSPFKFLDFINDVKVGWTLTDERELNYRVETIKMIFLFVISRVFIYIREILK